MSGRPNSLGVKVLRQALLEVGWLRERIAAEKEALAQHQNLLSNYQEQLLKQAEEINKAMIDMDVCSPGNYGYEERRFELLLMLAGETR